jgi:hypothetical protein
MDSQLECLIARKQLESLPKQTYHRVFGGSGDVKHLSACM